MKLNRENILTWLREEEDARLARLFAQADETRRQCVGDEVHLRGLLEISNHCRRSCGYCGLRAGNSTLSRYRMTSEEILACAREAHAYGYGTVVMQSGEDPALDAQQIAHVIRSIKAETPLAVTLSLGEWADAEYELWRRAGADRYLLRFETSNRRLYDSIHPPVGGRTSDRVAILKRLREMGYEIGSGVMIGIPGQDYDTLADDILLFRELDLDMVGVGPYLPHPETPLGLESRPAVDQVPNTEKMTYKVVALTRLACPEANIPSTTALATVNKEQGRELGLLRGANVVMPNITPAKYRVLYEIYPGKACLNETAEACHGCMLRRIASIGRKVGTGQGSRRCAAEVVIGKAQ